MDLYHGLAESFYRRVGRDQVLRPLYSPGSLRCPARVLGEYFAELFGTEPAKRHWWASLREFHQRFRIGPEHRDRWLEDMRGALEEGGWKPEWNRFFELSAGWIAGGSLEGEIHDPEIARLWEGWRAVEGAVAAARVGDRDTAARLAENPASPRGWFFGILSVMPDDYVLEVLAADPAIAKESHGRTLLHDAAGAGRVVVVREVLRVGADPNARDEAGHTPLYHVANRGGGGESVRLLTGAGADVNLRNGVTRATALHVAARRGNVDVAQALLDCGADRTIRDAKGDTPLERAVNCRKRELVRVLNSPV
jgi:truncated hemoglobin YjbI